MKILFQYLCGRMTENTKPLASEYRIPDEKSNPEPEYYRVQVVPTLNLLFGKCLTKAIILKTLLHFGVKWKIRDATSSVRRSVLLGRPCHL